MKGSDELLMIALSYAPALVALIGGIWAVKRIRQPDIRDRPDRSAAMWLVVAVALVAGLGLGVLAASAAVIFSGTEPNLAIGLTFGLAAGAVFGLAGTLGYAVLARLRIGVVAVTGTLIGPALLIGATILASTFASTIGLAALDKEVTQHTAEVAARSAALHMSVEAKDIDTARDGAVVAAVHLRVRLSTDVAVSFNGAQENPCFVLFPPDPEAAMYLDACAPAGSPKRIGAGESQVYDLTFRYSDELINETQGTYRAGPPGTWTLRVSFVDPADREYEVKAPLELR